MADREPMDPIVMRPLQVEVQADPNGKNPNATYRVQLPHCDCPDFRYRDHADDDDPHLCKHILGVWRRTYGWRQPSDVDEVLRMLAKLPPKQVRTLLRAAATKLD